MDTQNISIVAAEDLARNSRVVRDMGGLPYLVDSARVQEDGTILVKFSSGDQVTYNPLDAVIVRN